MIANEIDSQRRSCGEPKWGRTGPGVDPGTRDHLPSPLDENRAILIGRIYCFTDIAVLFCGWVPINTFITRGAWYLVLGASDRSIGSGFTIGPGVLRIRAAPEQRGRCPGIGVQEGGK